MLTQEELTNMKALVHPIDVDNRNIGFELDATMNNGLYKKELEKKYEKLLDVLMCSVVELVGITMINIRHKGIIGCIDFSGLANLEYLSCESNQLSSLDLSGLVNLKELDCSHNQLNRLDLSGLDNLERLYCYCNKLTTKPNAPK